jgi:protein-tyrosine-phosphatase
MTPFHSVVATCAVLAVIASAQASSKTTVVFVCEHGAARSVIAAAYFNKLAAERHLQYRAIARGTSPQDDLSPAAVEGLKADGVPFDTAKPRPLTEADAAEAVRIVAFCPVPKSYASVVRVDQHDDVPSMADYRGARDVIVGYVRQVLDDLEAGARTSRP